MAWSYAKAKLRKVISKCLEELADHKVDTSQMLWGGPGAWWAGFKLKNQEGCLAFSISNWCLLSKGQIGKVHVLGVRKDLIYWWPLPSLRFLFLSKSMQKESNQQRAILFYRGLTIFIVPDSSLSFPLGTGQVTLTIQMRHLGRDRREVGGREIKTGLLLADLYSKCQCYQFPNHSSKICMGIVAETGFCFWQRNCQLSQAGWDENLGRSELGVGTHYPAWTRQVLQCADWREAGRRLATPNMPSLCSVGSGEILKCREGPLIGHHQKSELSLRPSLVYCQSSLGNLERDEFQEGS